MKLEKYRPTMTNEVLNSWAQDAQKRIEELEAKRHDVFSRVHITDGDMGLFLHALKKDGTGVGMNISETRVGEWVRGHCK